MARRLPLAILAAGALLLAAAAPAGADDGADCGGSPTSQPSAACGSFDLPSIMAEIMQLQQQENQAYAAEARSQLSTPNDAYSQALQAAQAQYDSALAGSVSSIAAGAVSQHPAGVLMAHVPGGGPLSGALAAAGADQRP